MASLRVFDRPLCCSTGICGPDVDPALVAFAADLQWLARKGVDVERINPAWQPTEFAAEEWPAKVDTMAREQLKLTREEHDAIVRYLAAKYGSTVLRTPVGEINVSSELIRRKGIEKLLEHEGLLKKVEADTELVKTLLTHKNLLTPKTRALARKVIDKVVNELKKRLETQIEQTLLGAIRRDRHSPRRIFRNLDLKTTLRRNLKNWDDERERLLIDKVSYFAAEKHKRPWHIIVCVDQSGSMMESTIFSAVMASIFAELPAFKTSLVLYDTRLVDLSNQLGSPVDTLMSAQLGGGNDTPLALRYCQKLLREPARTILVLISDFYEALARTRWCACSTTWAAVAFAVLELPRSATTRGPNTTSPVSLDSERLEWMSCRALPRSW